LGTNGEKLSLSDNERTEFAEFFRDTYSHFPYTAKEVMRITDDKASSPLPRMFDIFHQSFSVTDISTAALLRTSVLEMLLEEGSELSYRLARSIAVLLGNNIEKSVEVFKSVKKIYGARSKFVHNGKRIKKEDAELAHKITCDVLRKLYAINDNMKTIQSMLHQGAFGIPPF